MIRPVTATYIALGPQCWGRGATVGQAVNEARKHLPTFNVNREAQFSVYRVDPIAEVSADMGWLEIITPHDGQRPEFVRSVPVFLNGV